MRVYIFGRAKTQEAVDADLRISYTDFSIAGWPFIPALPAKNPEEA